MVYFDHVLDTIKYACQYSLTTGMQNYLFDGRGFAEHQSSLLWSVNKINKNLEPYGIFGSIVAYLITCILILHSRSHAKW